MDSVACLPTKIQSHESLEGLNIAVELSDHFDYYF